MALVGGLSAGTAKYMGGNAAARLFTGAAAGGVSSVMAEGDFAQGVVQGAMTSAIAYLCNCEFHEIIEYIAEMESTSVTFRGGGLDVKGRIVVQRPITDSNVNIIGYNVLDFYAAFLGLSTSDIPISHSTDVAFLKVVAHQTCLMLRVWHG